MCSPSETSASSRPSKERISFARSPRPNGLPNSGRRGDRIDPWPVGICGRALHPGQSKRARTDAADNRGCRKQTIMQNMTYLSLLIVVILASAGLTSCVAKNSDAPSSSAADIPRIAFEKYTLPNGLDVILSRDTRVPMVAVNLWYHVGPANEEPGRTGFAHLFEHMMFQSSKHVPPDSHFKLLEAAGATSINGTTGYDRTNYFETVPSNQLDLALWLESDRMGYLLDKIDV